MNQSDLGDAMTALGFPMDKTKVSKLENGRETRVDVDKLLALATVLDVIPDRLLRDPEELDSEIFRRLLARWREYNVERLTFAARAQAISLELHKLAERSEILAEFLERDKSKLEEYEQRVSAEVRLIDIDSPGYGEYLDHLLTGETAVLLSIEELLTMEGGK